MVGVRDAPCAHPSREGSVTDLTNIKRRAAASAMLMMAVSALDEDTADDITAAVAGADFSPDYRQLVLELRRGVSPLHELDVGEAVAGATATIGKLVEVVARRAKKVKRKH